MDKYIDNYNDSKKVTYHEQTDISNILKLRAVLKTLPDFCKDYFRAMDPLTTTKTRISYAYDIRIFFQFLLDENPAFKDYSMKDFTVDVLDQLKAIDIEEYQPDLPVSRLDLRLVPQEFQPDLQKVLLYLQSQVHLPVRLRLMSQQQYLLQMWLSVPFLQTGHLPLIMQKVVFFSLYVLP